MAISRIGGRALKANLERDSNLTFNTDTLAIDYANGRVGIGTTTPTEQLEITGNLKIGGTINMPAGNLTVDQIAIAGNKIESAASNANLTLDANGTGVVDIRANTTIDGSITLQSGVAVTSILDEDDLNSDSATALVTQQSIKAYVDAQVAGGSDTGAFTFTDNRLQTTVSNEEIIIEPAGTGYVAIDANSGLIVPVGTTAQRPTGQTGMMRFNTTTSLMEVYNGSSWVNVGGSTVTLDEFDGDDTETAFSLSQSATAATVIVSINGVVQESTNTYSVSGTTLTFNEAPATGDKIQIRNFFSGSELQPASKFQSYTTTERNALSPSNGDVVYNSTTHKFQGYANSGWVDFH